MADHIECLPRGVESVGPEPVQPPVEEDEGKTGSVEEVET